MTKPIEEILAPKPEARPRIYAYTIDDKVSNSAQYFPLISVQFFPLFRFAENGFCDA